MANPQKEHGYTAIANEIYDQLMRIRIPNECERVLKAVIRKTYGYQKKKDKIPLSQFEQMTGLKKKYVCRALVKLLVSF